MGEWGFVQTLSSTLQANTTYTLTVAVGNIASGAAIDTTYFDLSGFPGYRIDLLAGGVVLASDNNTLTAIPEGEFATSTVTFTTGAAHDQLGAALGIRLVNLNVDDLPALDQHLEVDFDDVQLTATAIPEPSTYAVVAAVLALLAVLRRKR